MVWNRAGTSGEHGEVAGSRDQHSAAEEEAAKGHHDENAGKKKHETGSKGKDLSEASGGHVPEGLQDLGTRDVLRDVDGSAVIGAALKDMHVQGE